jgi:hypothetical protein
MVLITPPEGWVSAHATELASVGVVAAIPRSGPPPITKVSQTFLTLDLDPEKSAGGWQKLLSQWGHSKVAWTATAASICVVGLIIWLWVASSPTTVEVAQLPADLPTKLTKIAPKLAPIPKIANQPAPPLPEPVAPVAPPADLNPQEVKPVEPQVAEVQPAGAKEEPKPAEVIPVEIKPIEAKPAPVDATVEAKPIEADPVVAEPAAVKEDPPKVADAGGIPALHSIPDMPKEVALKPVTAEKPAPLPVTAAKLIKQAAPQVIDVESRLDDVVANLELQDVPLVQALSIVSTMSTLPITLDADALQRQGISPREPISVNVKNCTFEELLDGILSHRGLGVEVEKGQVVITASAEQTDTLRTVPYTIADLCDNGTTTADLAELLQKFIAPDTWQTRGGQGTIKIENGALKIGQTGAVHREIVIFCEKLRLARGLSLRSKLDPSRLQLTSAYAQAKPLLDKPVSANFHEPTTLSQILDNLGSRAGVDILLDRQALAAAGMTDKMEISYTVEKQPLETALENLLRPLKLSYRAIDSHTLEVATQKEIDRHLEWEIYPVGKLLSVELTGRDLIAKTKQSVAPSSWTANTTIVFDPPSKSLLVSQSPAVQAALSRYLSENSSKK